MAEGGQRPEVKDRDIIKTPSIFSVTLRNLLSRPIYKTSRDPWKLSGLTKLGSPGPPHSRDTGASTELTDSTLVASGQLVPRPLFADFP